VRDATNRKLAKLGEEFVYNLERSRLEAEDRDDLAIRVQGFPRRSVTG
jgi:hypothetical protein